MDTLPAQVALGEENAETDKLGQAGGNGSPGCAQTKAEDEDGSRAMLRMPPAVIPTMAKAARPWSRSRLFMIKEHIIKGVARKI